MKTIAVSIPEGIYDAYNGASEQEKRKAELEVSNLLKVLFRKKLNQELMQSIKSRANAKH